MLLMPKWLVYSLVYPDPFSCKVLSIRDDKCPREECLVQFIGLTGTNTFTGDNRLLYHMAQFESTALYFG